MKTTVVAAYNFTVDANRAIEALVASGFHRSSIGLLCTEDARGHHFKVTESSKAAEGVVGGGVLGAVLGSLAAGLVAAGIIAAPGLGLVAAGPVVAILAGAGAGATTGGLVGGLVGMGIPEVEAKIVEAQIVNGGVVVTVDAENEDGVRKATEIFETYDAKIVTAPRS